MKAYCVLGKYGDILTVLPLLLFEYQKTGIKPHVVVSGQFADILEGVTYVEPVIYDGGFGDIRGAVKFAKQRFSKVIILQMHGKDYEVERLTPSFQLDSWLRARCLSRFQELPLVFNNRSGIRERILFKNTIHRLEKKHRPFEKYILVGDHSESSDFKFTEELVLMLKAEFEPNFRVIRLSEVKAERIFDLLSIYEKASCLVTIDTSHAHLSKASCVPTIVLAADGWRGTAQHRAFRFYCRYSEWPNRKNRLMFEVSDAIAKKPLPKIANVPTGFDHGYNMSCLRVGDRVVRSYRFHPEKDWRTMIGIGGGERDLQLQLPEELKGFSVEDMRLFMFNGSLHGSYTVATVRNGRHFCVIAYGRLVENESGWKLEGHTVVQYPGNDFSMMQKNWVFFESAGKLFAIYGVKGDHQIVIQIEGSKVITEHRAKPPHWLNGEVRGGVVVPHSDGMLRFFHSRIDYPDKHFRYFVGACTMESSPPFNTIKTSTASILYGDEIFTDNCWHWKPNVVFPLGCLPEGGKFILSVGINDSRCAMVELTEKQLNLL